MQAGEVVYFDDVSPFNEQVFSFPFIGKLSMRQIAIVGFGALLTWILYGQTHNLASLAPIGLCGFLALRRFNVISTEVQMIGILKFLFGSNKQAKPLAVKKSKYVLVKTGSAKLGVSSEFAPKLDIVGKEIPTRDIFTDPQKPVRLQVKIVDQEGKALSKTKTRITIDGIVISTMSTTLAGEIEVVFVPGSLGEKRLAIYAEGLDLPVFENILNIKSL